MIKTATIPLKQIKWFHQWLLNEAADLLELESTPEMLAASQAYDRAAVAIEVIISLATYTQENPDE